MSATRAEAGQGQAETAPLPIRILSPQELEIITWLEETPTPEQSNNVLITTPEILKVHASYGQVIRCAKPNEAALLTSEEIPLLP